VASAAYAKLRKILGVLSLEKGKQFTIPQGVCDKLVLEHGYNTRPAWAHE
jgi:hypothetical protein